MTSQNKDVVVLLHGIMRHKVDMLRLAGQLHKNSYSTLNIFYPSHSKSLEQLSTLVHHKISTSKKCAEAPNIHFVTHSMGGLIARYYIDTYSPKNLGKVVMLSPPNSGSECADFLDNQRLTTKLFKTIWGPAGQQLRTHHIHDHKPITYPLGIIAGNKSSNPLAFVALKGEHDGMVPVERTKIEGMTDHIILPVTHTFMMFNKQVAKQTLHFLEKNKFKSVDS